MSQLVAELVDERPCAHEVAVHVRSLVVHVIPVFDSPERAVSVKVEIKLPSARAKVAPAEHVISHCPKWSSSRQVSIPRVWFIHPGCNYYRPVLRKGCVR